MPRIKQKINLQKGEMQILTIKFDTTNNLQSQDPIDEFEEPDEFTEFEA